MEPITADDPVMVGGFRLKARLGAGGMGQVYLGTSAGGRAVAVKVVRPELAQDTEFIRRFRHEVAAAQRVSGAFTAPVIAAGLEAKPPWLATAFVPGPSLQDWVEKSGPLPEPAVRRLAAGLAEALSAVHACGLVHRDLKPSNVLLAEDGPRVIDFGISRARYGSAVTVPGYVVGTPPFMSPEQARGNPVGPASDIFSLGAVLCLAATGRPPFGDGDSVVVLYRIVCEAPAIDGIPAPLHDLIARCLTKDPAGRPRPAELMRALAGDGDDSRVLAGSFWPPEVAQRLRDFRSRLDKGLPEPVFVAQFTPPTRADLAAQTDPAFAAQTAPAFAAPPTPPPHADLPAQTSSVTRHGRGRRALLIGGGLTAAVAALLVVALWPSSPRHLASGTGTDAAATLDVTPDGTPTPANTPTRSASSPSPSPTPQVQSIHHVTSLATRSASSPTTKPRVQTTHQVASPAAGPPTATVPASVAIAPQCGPTCITLYSPFYSEVLGVEGEQNTGEPVDLEQASATSGDQDWILAAHGTVGSFYSAGLVSAAIDQHYGSDEAYEYEYTPWGVITGMCLGASGTAQNGTPVTLQPCGVSGKTVWVSDAAAQYGEQAPLINGTDTAFTQPYVLTASGTGTDPTTSSLAETSGSIRDGQFWVAEH